MFKFLRVISYKTKSIVLDILKAMSDACPDCGYYCTCGYKYESYNEPVKVEAQWYGPESLYPWAVWRIRGENKCDKCGRPSSVLFAGEFWDWLCGECEDYDEELMNYQWGDWGNDWRNQT